MKKTISQTSNKSNIPLGATAPLGILPKDRPAATGVASSFSGQLQNDQKTGANEARMLRYVRQSAARRLLQKTHRVSWCLRRTEEGQLPVILKNMVTGASHYGGLISCGRIWGCPVCAAKVANRRRDELSSAINVHRSNGGSLLLVTYTFSHCRHDNLVDLLARQKKAWNALKSSKIFKSIKSAHGLIGTVRAQEITHGANGWHPHYHELWFLKSENQLTINAIQTRLYDAWRYQCVRHGLGEPSLEHGVDVRDGTHASTYVSKWGIEDEMTKISSKKGKSGGRSPFQLLDAYIEGDKQAGALFCEYVEAFKSARQLVWSKGLKKMFEIVEKSDEILATEELQHSDILGVFDLEQWRFILRSRSKTIDLRCRLLSVSEIGGWTAVLEFLDSIGFVSELHTLPVRVLESSL